MGGILFEGKVIHKSLRNDKVFMIFDIYTKILIVNIDEWRK